MDRRIYTKVIFLVFFLVSLLSQSTAFAEIIDVQIKGIDDGIKTSKQQDYKEASLFAKREAIERAGVEIASITTVKDLTIYEDLIESKAKAVLLPGYTIVDIGYSEDGEYTVILIGKVDTSVEDKEEEADADADTSSDTDRGEPAEASDQPGNLEKESAETGKTPVPAKPVALMTVKTAPRGAFVSLDGKFIAKSPILKWKTTPGKHRLTVTLKGYHRRSMEIMLFPGDLPSNHFKLNLIPAKKKIPQSPYRPSLPPKPKPF
jgi:PEGA domain-containing protein